jgi:hypothetical protein
LVGLKKLKPKDILGLKGFFFLFLKISMPLLARAATAFTTELNIVLINSMPLIRAG